MTNSKIGSEELRILAKAANILKSDIYFPNSVNNFRSSPKKIADDIEDIVFICKKRLNFTEDESTFISLVYEIDNILYDVEDGALTWKDAYHAIFSNKIAFKIWKTGCMPDYYDPDESYEEDVLAFYDAAYSKMIEIKQSK